jgi:hypothetical protein
MLSFGLWPTGQVQCEVINKVESKHLHMIVGFQLKCITIEKKNVKSALTIAMKCKNF